MTNGVFISKGAVNSVEITGVESSVGTSVAPLLLDIIGVFILVGSIPVAKEFEIIGVELIACGVDMIGVLLEGIAVIFIGIPALLS